MDTIREENQILQGWVNERIFLQFSNQFHCLFITFLTVSRKYQDHIMDALFSGIKTLLASPQAWYVAELILLSTLWAWFAAI